MMEEKINKSAIESLYDQLSVKNPKLKQAGFDKFEAAMQDSSKARAVFDQLSVKNPKLSEGGFDRFYSTITKKKEEPEVIPSDVSGGVSPFQSPDTEQSKDYTALFSSPLKDLIPSMDEPAVAVTDPALGLVSDLKPVSVTPDTLSFNIDQQQKVMDKLKNPLKELDANTQFMYDNYVENLDRKRLGNRLAELQAQYNLESAKQHVPVVSAAAKEDFAFAAAISGGTPEMKILEDEIRDIEAKLATTTRAERSEAAEIKDQLSLMQQDISDRLRKEHPVEYAYAERLGDDSRGFPKGGRLMVEFVRFLTDKKGHEEYRGLRRQVDLIDRAIEYYNSVEQGKKRNAVMRLWDGLSAEGVSDIISLGVSSLSETYDIYKITKKLEDEGDQSLTDDEKSILVLNNMKNHAKEMASRDRAFGVGLMIGESAPFMAQMAATYGVGSAIRGAVFPTLGKKMAEQAAKGGAKDFTANMAIQATKQLTDATTRIWLMPMQYRTAIEYAMPKIGTDDSGEFMITEEGDSWLKAFAKASANTAIEVFSEGAIGEGLDWVSMKAGRYLWKNGRKIFNGSTFDDIERAVHGISGKMPNGAHFIPLNRPLSEFGEEVFAGLTQPLVTGEGTLKDFFNGETMLRTLMMCSIMSGVPQSVGTVNRAAGYAQQQMSIGRGRKIYDKLSDGSKSYIQSITGTVDFDTMAGEAMSLLRESAKRGETPLSKQEFQDLFAFVGSVHSAKSQIQESGKDGNGYYRIDNKIYRDVTEFFGVLNDALKKGDNFLNVEVKNDPAAEYQLRDIVSGHQARSARSAQETWLSDNGVNDIEGVPVAEAEDKAVEKRYRDEVRKMEKPEEEVSETPPAPVGAVPAEPETEAETEPVHVEDTEVKSGPEVKPVVPEGEKEAGPEVKPGLPTETDTSVPGEKKTYRDITDQERETLTSKELSDIENQNDEIINDVFMSVKDSPIETQYDQFVQELKNIGVPDSVIAEITATIESDLYIGIEQALINKIGQEAYDKLVSDYQNKHKQTTVPLSVLNDALNDRVSEGGKKPVTEVSETEQEGEVKPGEKKEPEVKPETPVTEETKPVAPEGKPEAETEPVHVEDTEVEAGPEVKPEAETKDKDKKKEKPKKEVKEKKQKPVTHNPSGGKVIKIGRLAARFSQPGSMLSASIKDAIESGEIGAFIPMSDAEAGTLAEGIVKGSTIDEIYQVILEGRIHPSVKVNLLTRLLTLLNNEYKAAEKAGDAKAMAEWSDRSLTLIDEWDDMTRESAYILRMVGNVAFLENVAPSIQKDRYAKDIDKARQQILARQNGKKGYMERKADRRKRKLKEQYDDIVGTTTNQGKLFTEQDVKKAIAEAVKRMREKEQKAKKEKEQKPKKTPESKPSHINKDKWKELNDKQKSIIDQWKKDNKGVLQSAVIPGVQYLDLAIRLLPVALEKAGYVAQIAIDRIAELIKRDFNVDIDKNELAKNLPAQEELLEKIREIEADKAAHRLASGLLGLATNKRSVPDPISLMINTLLGKAREQMPQKATKLTDIQRIAEAIKNKDKYKETWDAAFEAAKDMINNNRKLASDQKAALHQKLKDVYDHATKFEFSDAMLERVMKRKFKDFGHRIEDVVSEFYQTKEEIRGNLVDALIEDAGLENEQAEYLAKIIEGRFGKMINEMAAKFIAKEKIKLKEKIDQNDPLAREAAKIHQKVRKDAADKLIELIKAGAFNDPEFLSAYAEAHGLSTFSEQHADKLMELAQKVQDAKNSRSVSKAKQDLLTYRRYMDGLSFADWANAFWFSSVLSGVKTQERNFVGAFSGITLKAMGTALIHGRLSPFISYIRGLKYGGSRARDVFATGVNPFQQDLSKSKLEMITEQMKARGSVHASTPSDAEIIYNMASGRWKKLAIVLPMVGRLMTALDVFNVTAGEEFFIDMLTREHMGVSRSKTLYDSAYRKQIQAEVDKFLRIDKETIDEIKAEIEEEGEDLTAREKKLLLYDKIMERRKESPDDQERMVRQKILSLATRHATEATGNLESYGLIGLVSSLLADVFKALKIPVAKNKLSGEYKLIAPLALVAAFTKIAGNVATQSVNYVPGLAILSGRILPWKGFHKDNGKWVFDWDNVGLSYGIGLENTRYKGFHHKIEAEDAKIIAGQQLLGTLAYLVFWTLSDPGDDDDPIIRITGNGTGDYEKNRSLPDWREYSIGIKVPRGGRVWFSYKYTPMLLSLGIIGNIRDRSRFNKEKDDTLNGLVNSVIMMPSLVSDLSAIGGMMEMLAAISGYEEKPARIVIRNVERIIAGYYSPGIYRDAVDFVEWVAGVGMDQAVHGSELSLDMIQHRLVGRSPIAVYKRLTTAKEERIERVDVYGRTLFKSKFWEEIVAPESELSEDDKIINRSLDVFGMPSVPRISTTQFIIPVSDGSYARLPLDAFDKEQAFLFFEYTKRRGERILDEMRMLDDMYLGDDKTLWDTEGYVTAMEKAVMKISQEVRAEINEEIDELFLNGKIFKHAERSIKKD